jgi:hypothetical protein
MGVGSGGLVFRRETGRLLLLLPLLGWAGRRNAGSRRGSGAGEGSEWLARVGLQGVNGG